MNRSEHRGAIYAFHFAACAALGLSGISMVQAANNPAATSDQPTPAQVLKAIYGKDSHGESNFDLDNGRYASYWFSYSFSLGGVSYFTGFASNTLPIPPGRDSNVVPGVKVTITAATYQQAKARTSRSWSLLGAQSNIGQFGVSGSAIEVDKTQIPPSYRTPAGKLVLAIPGGAEQSGEWISSYELFAFDPHLAGKNAAYWTYMGSIDAGEDNSDSCGSYNPDIPCVKKQGKLTFAPAQGEDMPAIQVSWSGTDLDAAAHVRNLGPSDARHYHYDAASKTYKETKL